MKHWKKIVLIFIGLIVLTSLIAPIIKSRDQSLKLHSINNLNHISLASLTYSLDHNNQLPPDFSTLIPDYCNDDTMFYLLPRSFKPYTFGNIEEDFYPHREEAKVEFVNALSPYRLLHLPKASWAAIHETLGIWKDGSMAWIFLKKSQNNEWIREAIIHGSIQEFETSILSKSQ